MNPKGEHSKKSKVFDIAGIAIVFAVSLATVVWGGTQAFHSFGLRWRGETVAGNVTRVQRGQGSLTITVRYTVGDETFTLALREHFVSKPMAREGETIWLFYDPSNPGFAGFGGIPDGAFYSLLFGAMGVVGAVALAGANIQARRKANPAAPGRKNRNNEIAGMWRRRDKFALKSGSD